MVLNGAIENPSEIHSETFVLCAIASLRLCVIVFQFNEKGAKAQRVLSISVVTSFALLYIQLTITEITGFPDSAVPNIPY